MFPQPFVSVLMTAYNREKLITEAIESVLACSYSNFELIIVDDQSTDNTLGVIKQYALKDTRIRYYQNEKNLGDYPNRNRAASYATADYIAYLDSDDKMLPGGLAMCIDAMQKFPQSGIGMYWLYSKEAPFCFAGNDAIKQHFFKQQLLIIGPGGTLLKRSFFEKMGGYPEKYGPANDMYFNLKAACYSDVVLFPFEFIFYRQHEAQENKNQFGYLYNNYLYLSDALNELPLPLSGKEKQWIANKSKRRFFVNLVKHFFTTGNLKQIIVAVKKSRYSFSDLLNGLFH